ncbi:MAG: CBS domain-containing protein [Chloroflexota bacterium]
MTSFRAKVSEWMTTPVVSVSPSTTLIEADRTMTEYGIRRLPVIENGKLVGIITKGDVREARASTANSLSIWELNYLVARLKVEQVMHGNVLTLTGDDDIADAADLMMNKKISGIPVLDGKQQVIGIITESDIFRMLVQQRENQPA